MRLFHRQSSNSFQTDQLLLVSCDLKKTITESVNVVTWNISVYMQAIFFFGGGGGGGGVWAFYGKEKRGEGEGNRKNDEKWKKRGGGGGGGGD